MLAVCLVGGDVKEESCLLQQPQDLVCERLCLRVSDVDEYSGAETHERRYQQYGR